MGQAQPVKSILPIVGVTQKRLAAALDVDAATMSRLLNGFYWPSQEQATRVASYLGLPEHELWRPERRAARGRRR